MTLVCPSCGRENPEDARFCAGCATPLTAPEAGREERKVLTVLFADLVGFTARAEQLDPEEVRALQAPYWARVRSELERYGGTVEKFIGDAVMALFGAPTAHEDDPERAVRAALAIRDWAKEEGELEVRIGITTGEALVFLNARPEAGEGMASGDVVNTASRLQAAAPVNGVLVDEATFRSTRDRIEYAQAQPVTAKGKAEAASAWPVAQARSSFGVDVTQDPVTPLVGRERERALLLEALERARDGREPQLVTLVGVPGIGKSRLVYELSRAADADPELINWRQGRCLPYGEGVTFWAVAEMVKAEVGALESDPADLAAEKLRGTVDTLVDSSDEATWLERHLRPLLGLGTEEATGSDRRVEAFAAWRRFFESLAERRPLVLVFEDLHWADEDLLDFVDHLVDWAAEVPLLCVCTTRPELRERRPGWGGGKANAVTISLPALADDDIARLVAVLVERPVLPADQQLVLLARAGGNPLYAEQYARVLAERGDLDEHSLPETIQGMIAARLDGLAPDEKELLQDAAVLGKVFWLGALAHMEDAAPFELEERLHALERKEFVRRERRPSIAGEREHAFRHLLVRDVAYGQIPRGARAQKHQRVAEWLETVAPDRSEDLAEMLAHHYVATLELSKAAGLDVSALADPARLALTEAGDRAMALSAPEPARRFYAAALELVPKESPERAHLLLRQARSLAGIMSDEGMAGLQDAIPTLLAAGDVQAAAEAEAALADGFWIRGARGAADDHAARAAELVAGDRPSPTMLAVLASRSRLLLVGGEGREAVAVAREGLAAADELGRKDFRAQFLVTIGASRALQLGDFGGLADLEEGLEVAQAAKMPGTIQRGFANLAELYRRMGRGGEAAAMLAAGRESNERYGHRTGLMWMDGEEAVDRFAAGAWDEALALSQELLEFAEAGSGHYHEPMCRMVRARIWFARGQQRDALAESERAVDLARTRKDPQVMSPVLALRSQILMPTEAAEAERVAQEALGAQVEFVASVPLAWTFVDLARPDDLRPALAGLGAPVWAGAATAILDGAFTDAADRLAEMGESSEEAYARLRVGTDEQVGRALEFYRSVGATRYVHEGESLLARTA